jgi:Holliday junction resolvase
MLDFTVIENGEEFEQLCEDLLLKKGIEIISKPFRGPDYGVDILANVIAADNLGIIEKQRVLIECKHFAKSNRSVRESDIGNVIERAISNNCNKYLLITSTTVSSVISHQLKGITNNPSIPLSAAFWAKNDLDKMIHEFEDIKKRYFTQKIKSNKTSVLNIEPKINLGIHSHPDFTQELKKIVKIWNNKQQHVLFMRIKS